MNRPALILAVAMVIAMPMATASSETLTIGTRTETTSIDPHFYSWVPNSNIDLHFFDHIVMLDEDQQVKPRLAVSWKPIDDKSWEFKLRKGVKFHDGTPFTADDIAFTVKRAPSLKRASPAGNFVRDKKITVIDDYTFPCYLGPAQPADAARIGGHRGPLPQARRRRHHRGLQHRQGDHRHRGLQVRRMGQGRPRGVEAQRGLLGREAHLGHHHLQAGAHGSGAGRHHPGRRRST